VNDWGKDSRTLIPPGFLQTQGGKASYCGPLNFPKYVGRFVEGGMDEEKAHAARWIVWEVEEEGARRSPGL